MQANRSRDTKPELAVRRAAFSLGLRYLVCARPIPTLRRTADLVFPRAKIAVFVDGCYWHGCPAHHRRPTINGRYWTDKIERNRRRDVETDAILVNAGWLVIRSWEHEDAQEVAQAIQAAFRRHNLD